MMSGSPPKWPRHSGAGKLLTVLVGIGLLAGCQGLRGSDVALEPFDPLRGVDPDGRIPKIEMPEDIEHPERWRYIPPGRIKPGGVIDRFLYSTFIFPVVYYDQEVGYGGGVAITDLDFRTQRRREFAGMGFALTTEGQQRYTIGWRRWLNHRLLPGGGALQEERSTLGAFGGYTKTLTRRFFGLGPDTQATDETSYTDEVTFAGLGLNLALPRAGDNWILTASLGGEHHNLSRGRVQGIPSMDEDGVAEHSALFKAGDEHDGVWLSAGLAYDTRDSQHMPYKGVRAAVVAAVSPWQSRGKTGGVFGAEASTVIKVPALLHGGGDRDEQHPPTDTVGVGAQVAWTTGDVPFYDLPTLGGSNTLRGYIAHRWTGRAAWHAAIEYRFWVMPRGFQVLPTIRIERIGLAVFYDIGTVADGFSALGSARVHDSYGVSVRMTLERQALFRVDVGVSDEDVNVTGGYGLSF